MARTIDLKRYPDLCVQDLCILLRDLGLQTTVIAKDARAGGGKADEDPSLDLSDPLAAPAPADGQA